VLVRLDHAADRIVNTNHYTVRAAVELRVADSVQNLAAPQSTAAATTLKRNLAIRDEVKLA
jgi:hypothetical protein